MNRGIVRKVGLAIFSLFISGYVLAQVNAEIGMADAMRSSGKIYVVVAVLCIVFLGIAAYLFMLDRKIGKLEKEQNESQ